MCANVNVSASTEVKCMECKGCVYMVTEKGDGDVIVLKNSLALLLKKPKNERQQVHLFSSRQTMFYGFYNTHILFSLAFDDRYTLFCT
jgi:hypothetical protein